MTDRTYDDEKPKILGGWAKKRSAEIREQAKTAEAVNDLLHKTEASAQQILERLGHSSLLFRIHQPDRERREDDYNEARRQVGYWQGFARASACNRDLKGIFRARNGLSILYGRLVKGEYPIHDSSMKIPDTKEWTGKEEARWESTESMTSAWNGRER